MIKAAKAKLYQKPEKSEKVATKLCTPLRVRKTREGNGYKHDRLRKYNWHNTRCIHLQG